MLFKCKKLMMLFISINGNVLKLIQKTEKKILQGRFIPYIFFPCMLQSLKTIVVHRFFCIVKYSTFHFKLLEYWHKKVFLRMCIMHLSTQQKHQVEEIFCNPVLKDISLILQVGQEENQCILAMGAAKENLFYQIVFSSLNHS